MEVKKILIDNDTIQERIRELAEQINDDYKEKKLTLICLLKGAVYFFADLTRHLDLDTELCFMRLSSYEGENSTGKIEVKIDIEEDIKGKDVLIVEDIIDSGNTLNFLKNYLLDKGPNSVKICTLLDKPKRREVENIKVDYLGFSIPNRFVIGYGMDLDESYRNLLDINCITQENDPKIEEDVKSIKLQLTKKNH